MLVVVGVVLDAVAADVIRPNIDTSCWFYGEAFGGDSAAKKVWDGGTVSLVVTDALI